MTSQRRPIWRSSVLTALMALPATLGLVACVSSGKAANKASDQRARELGLSSEALDPTVRERREGVGFWKSPEEPEGSASPMSPTRRAWSDQP